MGMATARGRLGNWPGVPWDPERVVRNIEINREQRRMGGERDGENQQRADPMEENGKVHVSTEPGFFSKTNDLSPESVWGDLGD